MRPALRRRDGGFTIIEVLMVVVILGVLVTMAVPSMRDLIASTKVKTAASDVFAALILARSEAIKRNAGMEIMPALAVNWGDGWTVRTAGTNLTIAQQDPITGGDVLITGPTDTIRYRGDGRLVDSAGNVLASEVAFTFVSANYSHINMRCIKIDPSGRPSVRTDTDRNSANGCTL